MPGVIFRPTAIADGETKSPLADPDYVVIPRRGTRGFLSAPRITKCSNIQSAPVLI